MLFLGTQFGMGPKTAIAQDLTRRLGQVISVPSQVEKSKSSLGAICPAQLGGVINAILQGRHSEIAKRPQFLRAHWGISIQTLSTRDGGSTLYATNAQHYFLPASNLKLLTTAAALRKLGSQFRIRTSVYGVGSSLVAALRVQGRGDPSLTDAQLRVLAQQLRRQGVRQVNQLIGSDDYFRGPILNPSWEVEDIQADYGAPVNSLILNQNAVELKLHPQAIGQPLRVEWANPIEAKSWRIDNSAIAVAATEPGSVNVSRDLGRPVIQISGQLPVNSEPESIAVAVPDPAQHFLRHFRQALLAQQISVNQTQVAPSRAMGERELAAVDSPPLAQLLVETNQESNNLYAESLLRTLGIDPEESLPNRSKVTMDSATERGLAVVKTTLTGLGVNPEGYVMADGSGLSRHNLVSPEALVQTLKAMAKLPEAATYRASLPVAGVSGTLQNRFRNTPAQGILHAKTGTLSGVSALSGYLNSPNFQPLVFSILVNQSDQPSPVLRQAIDEIVLLLTRLRSC
jgi:D-alanyl-D-alanine carboxypeptidase/D-alanyl-D-alanine-endopeptidase (penicillin-binding protein 4)